MVILSIAAAYFFRQKITFVTNYLARKIFLWQNNQGMLSEKFSQKFHNFFTEAFIHFSDADFPKISQLKMILRGA